MFFTTGNTVCVFDEPIGPLYVNNGQYEGYWCDNRGNYTTQEVYVTCLDLSSGQVTITPVRFPERMGVPLYVPDDTNTRPLVLRRGAEGEVIVVLTFPSEGRREERGGGVGGGE